MSLGELRKETQARFAATDAELTWPLPDLPLNTYYLDYATNRQLNPGCTIRLVTHLTEALQLLAQESWQLFLVDLALPDGSGIGFIEAANKKFPDVPLVVTTIFDDDTNLFNALAAGARGYLLKSQTPQQLKKELNLLKQGYLPMSPSIAQRWVGKKRVFAWRSST